ncbi:3-hydroxy-5-methyl-1-naphthoate 3-O-methyltransferase [Candidatus Entotheonellaceae bacterium PAL068K]
MQHWWTGLADTPPDDASALHALGLGFMAARTLSVALEFRLFTHLAGAGASLSQAAHAMGLTERAASRLLHACAALGLLQASAQGFRNTPLSAKYLVEDQPTFIGSYLQMFDDLGYHRWEAMSTALRHNAPIDAVHHPYRYLADDQEAARQFLIAQHAGSLSLGQALAHRIDFQPFHCLLDLGGGSGAYTVEILSRYPHVQAIIFDFPEVCRFAETIIQQAGLTTRVRLVAGDYERDPLPEGADIVLWSGNLHASSPTRCTRIVRSLAAVLPPGGTLLIHDYLLDDTRTGPLIPALLALHLTLVSEDGQVYSGAELHALLEAAGFAEVRIQPFLAGHSGLVIARMADTERKHSEGHQRL